MKSKKFILMLLVIGAMLSTSCRKTTEISSSYSYAPQESVCLSVDPDGSIVLRAWGTGANRVDAIEHAKKNVLNEVLFSGIKNGQKVLDPILLEVNAKEKYNYYFSEFFQDGGAYLKYVSTDDAKKNSDVKATNDFHDKYGVVVTVYREALRRIMIRDGIIKP